MTGVTQIAHALSERGNDLYETPECAVEALLAVENLPGRIWEPACGPGAIVRVLRRHGHLVLATDLMDYARPDQDAARRDFLLDHRLPACIEAILTNPPYKNADAFVAHAISLCPKVYMLLRLAFLESQRRSSILDSGKLARVYIFKNRLPMMHRHGWQGPRASSAIPFAWFWFNADHTGTAELRRISTTKKPPVCAGGSFDIDASIPSRHPNQAQELRDDEKLQNK